MVDARNSRIASSTCVSLATGERASFAKDSVIRMMASSWRTVIGMEDRALADISALCTCRRIETKCEESFSAASAERRGAHRLCLLAICQTSTTSADSRFAIADISLHLLERYLCLNLLFQASTTHMDAHHVSSYSLISALFMLIPDDEYHVETR